MAFTPCKRIPLAFLNDCRRYYTPLPPTPSPQGITCRVDDLLVEMRNAASPTEPHGIQQKKPGANYGDARPSPTLPSPARLHVEELFQSQEQGINELESGQGELGPSDDFAQENSSWNSELWMRGVESAEREAAFYRTIGNEASPLLATYAVLSRDAGDSTVPVDPNSASVLSQSEAWELDRRVASSAPPPDHAYLDDEIEFSPDEACFLESDDEEGILEHTSNVFENEGHTGGDKRVDLFGEASVLPSESLEYADDDTEGYKGDNEIDPDDPDAEEGPDVLVDSGEEIIKRFFEHQHSAPNPPLPSDERPDVGTEGLESTFEEDASMCGDDFRFFKVNQKDLEAVASSFSSHLCQQDSEGTTLSSEAFNDVAAQLAELKSMGESLPSPLR
ncbi:unnamed protein product [Phytomonas sp. EM1]|nr:unnamed protein product [Phytomonas sp. EM1]|eukprot:CCW60884.1 unnamed protein product [Phytomonas sp. isolate EM1]